MRELQDMLKLSLPLAVRVGAVLAGAFALSPGAAFAQCSMCRDAVAASSSQTREAMNYAIIGLALMPYGVAALAAWVLSPQMRASIRARFRRPKPQNPGDIP